MSSSTQSASSVANAARLGLDRPALHQHLDAAIDAADASYASPSRGLAP